MDISETVEVKGMKNAILRPLTMRWYSANGVPPPHVLWREDNFFLGQIWKFCFMYTWGVYRSFGIFCTTFDELNSRLWAQSFQQKKAPQKQKKWENAPKQPILLLFLCIRVTKYISPEFCRSCKIYILLIFLQMMMVWKLRGHLLMFKTTCVRFFLNINWKQ